MDNIEFILKELGIATRSSNGEWKSFDSIWGDLANMWKSLNENEQTEILINLELK